MMVGATVCMRPWPGVSVALWFDANWPISANGSYFSLMSISFLLIEYYEIQDRTNNSMSEC